MKFLLFAVSFLVATVFVFSGPFQDATNLLSDTEEFIRMSQKMVQEYNNHSKGHLISSVERKISELNESTSQLKHALEGTGTFNSTLLADYNETLLFLIGRVTEEFEIVAGMYHYNSTRMTPIEMVERSSKVVNETYAEITKKLKSDKEPLAKGLKDRYYNELTEELAAFNTFIDGLSYNSAIPNPKDEETVVRFEKSMKGLFSKIQKLPTSEFE